MTENYPFTFQKTRNEMSKWLIPLVIFVEVMLFEWEIFELYDLAFVQKLLKFIMVAILFMLIPAGKVKSPQLGVFLLLFSITIAWSLIPCLASDSPLESILLWFQFLVKLTIVYFIGIYLTRNSGAVLLILKFISVTATFVLFQIVANVTLIYLGIATIGQGEGFWGPLGIFGKAPIQIVDPDSLSIIAFRFYGFWREPSNASAFLFASSFIAFAVYSVEHQRRWKIIGLACILGGFTCLSNAGYFAFTSAMVFGVLTLKMKSKFIKFLFVVFLFSLIIFSLFGRNIVFNHFYDNAFLKGIVGVAQNLSSDEAKYYDASAGRISLLEITIAAIEKDPIGIGFRVPGGGFKEDVSASAPITFLLFTGPLGLVLLLAMEAYVIFCAFRFSKRSQFIRRLSQAWIVVFSQNIAYGNWMSVMFLFLTTCILVCGLIIQRRTDKIALLDCGRTTFA